uniref:tRNA(His) guanylyltransferase n=2 Tax=Arion vulgaris TaxID=1028688 RepID=A0A0B6ZC82_9EUPU
MMHSTQLRSSYSRLCKLNICHKILTSITKRTSLLTPLSLEFSTQKMAKSKFEYVKQFESDDPCLNNCWIVVRIDGKTFHKFTDVHNYEKPNDDRGLSLMTRAAQSVLGSFNDIVLAYGQSDEYSFVFHKSCKVYNRRASKIMTNVVSLFASSFTMYWPQFFNTQELKYPPAFDARVVLYPTDDNLKDYLSWRQADCHINNLYNTCFWKLVQEKGLTPGQAGDKLKGTFASDKNELLFSEFNTNYNNLPELYRKGTVIIAHKAEESPNSKEQVSSVVNSSTKSKKDQILSGIVLHTDIIGKQFWEEFPHILKNKSY